MTPKPVNRHLFTSEITCELVVKSRLARQFTDLLMPAVFQLSSLTYQAKQFLLNDQDEVIKRELTSILFEAYGVLEADREVLAQKQSEIAIVCPVEFIFGQSSQRRYRCYHPLSQVLFRILKDFIELDEQWCVFAWNADLVRQVDSSEQSEFLAYVKKQEEWLDRTRQLRLEIRSRVKILKEGRRSKPGQKL